MPSRVATCIALRTVISYRCEKDRPAGKSTTSWHVSSEFTMLGNSNRRQCSRTRNFILALILVSVLNGCGSYPGVMAGTWLFTLTSGASLSQVLATANLSQSGNEISGNVAFSGNGSGVSCNSVTSISGTLQGNELQLQFIESQSIANLLGTTNLAFTSGSGTYTVDESSCFQVAGSGSWSAVFIQ